MSNTLPLPIPAGCPRQSVRYFIGQPFFEDRSPVAKLRDVECTAEASEMFGIPLFSREEVLLGEQHDPADDSRAGGWGNACYNCGLSGHSFRDCPRPFNRTAVLAAKERSAAAATSSGSRYHAESGTATLQRLYGERFSRSSLSPELRLALGLKAGQGAPWMDRVLRFGCPPGMYEHDTTPAAHLSQSSSGGGGGDAGGGASAPCTMQNCGYASNGPLSRLVSEFDASFCVRHIDLSRRDTLTMESEARELQASTSSSSASASDSIATTDIAVDGERGGGGGGEEKIYKRIRNYKDTALQAPSSPRAVFFVEDTGTEGNGGNNTAGACNSSTATSTTKHEEGDFAGMILFHPPSSTTESDPSSSSSSSSFSQSQGRGVAGFASENALASIRLTPEFPGCGLTFRR